MSDDQPIHIVRLSVKEQEMLRKQMKEEARKKCKQEINALEKCKYGPFNSSLRECLKEYSAVSNCLKSHTSDTTLELYIDMYAKEKFEAEIDTKFWK